MAKKKKNKKKNKTTVKVKVKNIQNPINQNPPAPKKESSGIWKTIGNLFKIAASFI